MAPNDDWNPICDRSRLDRLLGVFVDCVYQICISKTDAARTRCAERSSDFLTPSPPAEKATTCQDQARKKKAATR
jgi:hypothetical protein